MYIVTHKIRNIYYSIYKISRALAEWRRKQPHVNEESLTDYLLWQISKTVPWVRYHKFSRRKEGEETGADWEWWFVDRQHALGMRVQAKLLHNSSKQNGKALLYRNKKGYQIEMLIRSSITKGVLPFYAFYWGNGTNKTLCQPSRTSDEGVFMAVAFRVYCGL